MTLENKKRSVREQDSELKSAASDSLEDLLRVRNAAEKPPSLLVATNEVQ